MAAGRAIGHDVGMRSVARQALLVGPLLFGAGACEGSSAPPEADPDAGAPTADVAAPDAGAACGRGGGAPCPTGAACASDDDCEGRCQADVCAAPSTTDGKRSPSLGETDVDCGGKVAPPCADAKACGADADCASKVCSTLTRTCVTAPSCRGASGAAGVETCGTSEPGAGGVVESCCRSLPLPVRTNRRLDRYEITAGRVRAFVDGVAAASAGVPNIRAWAKAYAKANPVSELGKLDAARPGLLDVLPDRASATAPVPLPVHLGAFALDPMNALDGCYVSPGSYGHATYWQPAADLATYGAPARTYPRETLDAKPMNCVMPLMLAAFCAWDGGELARTADYHEIWGNRAHSVGAATVRVPWATLLPVGDFNWRNGHGAACSLPWPGCVDPQPIFYAFPAAGHTPSADDTPVIGAPGRFSKDVTAATSADGAGWFDVGGNLMEIAWPVGTLAAGPSPIKDVCDTTATAGPGETPCTRQGKSGVRRYAGDLEVVALVGYSFEGHMRRSEAYLASATGDESLIGPGDVKPVTFQYGKVGGRCAR